MLRKVLLVLMAVVGSYGLAALAGYVLYMNSEGRSEAHLSIAVRFVISPLIAVLIGGLVGLLSKDHPIATSMVGLAPWAIMLLSPDKPASISSWTGWLVPILAYYVYPRVAEKMIVSLREHQQNHEAPSLRRGFIGTTSLSVTPYGPACLS